MIPRLIIVLVLAAGLIGLAAFEQIYIQGSYKHMERETVALLAIIEPLPDDAVGTPEAIKKVNDMYDWWIKRERHLTMLARHFDLSLISDALIYAKNFIHFDNKEETMAGLLRLQYLIKTHSFNVGTSVQNVI